MRAAATNVEQGIIPNSGHWIMEENPDATVALVTSFLNKPIPAHDRRPRRHIRDPGAADVPAFDGRGNRAALPVRRAA